MEGLVILGLLWLASALFDRAIKGGRGGKGGTQPRPRPRPRARPTPALRRPGAASPGGTGTQREGERLQELFERLGLELPLPEDDPVPMRRPRPEPAEEEWEPADVEVVSLELPPERTVPEAVSRDDEAERVIARRIREAEARSGALTLADHEAFDERIRVTRPPPVEGRAPARARLREAIVWREILGPPVALRDDDAWDGGR